MITVYALQQIFNSYTPMQDSREYMESIISMAMLVQGGGGIPHLYYVAVTDLQPPAGPVPTVLSQISN